MLTGCTEPDYTVWVGNATRDDVHVTDNHLECLPPRVQPSQSSRDHGKHGGEW